MFCRCACWDWAPPLCILLVVIFCHGLHLLQREASLVRAEDDTNLRVEGQMFRDCWDGLLVLADSPAIAMVSLFLHLSFFQILSDLCPEWERQIMLLVIAARFYSKQTLFKHSFIGCYIVALPSVPCVTSGMYNISLCVSVCGRQSWPPVNGALRKPRKRC